MDATSLRVQKGTGGMKGSTTTTRPTSTRRSTTRCSGAATSCSARPPSTAAGSQGELTLAGQTRPLALDVAIGDDGAVGATVTITQSDWGMKPYSALFGTLKVLDDVEVALEGHL